MVVGHLDVITGDRVGNGHRRGGGRLASDPGQIGLYGIGQPRKVGTGQHGDIGDGLTGRSLPGKARVGSPDVCQQTGIWKGLVGGHGRTTKDAGGAGLPDPALCRSCNQIT